MKTEVGSFTPSSGNNIIILWDDELVVKGVTFMISKDGATVNRMHGFTDGTRNRCTWSLKDSTVEDSGDTTSYCIYNTKKSGSAAVVANAASVVNFDTGEFTVNFANYDAAYTIYFMVVGE